MKRLPLVFSLLAATSFYTTVNAQQHRTVHADVARVVGPDTPVPMRMVGVGRAEEDLRADWQEQLATVQSEIGFQYLRMHGILNDEMGVYTEDKQGNLQPNFQHRHTLRRAAQDAHPALRRADVYAVEACERNEHHFLVEGQYLAAERSREVGDAHSCR